MMLKKSQLFDSPSRSKYFLTSRQTWIIILGACKSNARSPSFAIRCKQVPHERKTNHFLETKSLQPKFCLIFDGENFWRNALMGFQKYVCNLLFDSPPRSKYFFNQSANLNYNFGRVQKQRKKPQFCDSM